MNLTVRSDPSFRRDLWITLALLAVGLRILIPVGYMPARTGADQVFSLVLCTADGAVADPGAGERGGLPGKAGRDGPCVFTAQAIAGPALAPNIATRVAFALPEASLPVARPDLAPGRGLAAPPLPARGPPVLLG